VYASSDAEVKELDSRANIKAAAQSIAALGPQEKFEWAIGRKEDGNSFYKSKQFALAMEAYLQALTGLDLPDKEKELKERAREELQIPVLCNISACLLAEKVCDV
jgi:hypothetical protein